MRTARGGKHQTGGLFRLCGKRLLDYVAEMHGEVRRLRARSRVGHWGRFQDIGRHSSDCVDLGEFLCGRLQRDTCAVRLVEDELRQSVEDYVKIVHPLAPEGLAAG